MMWIIHLIKTHSVQERFMDSIKNNCAATIDLCGGSTGAFAFPIATIAAFDKTIIGSRWPTQSEIRLKALFWKVSLPHQSVGPPGLRFHFNKVSILPLEKACKQTGNCMSNFWIWLYTGITTFNFLEKRTEMQDRTSVYASYELPEVSCNKRRLM